MPIELRVPTFGESVVEATVGRWLKREGEAVAAGEPVVEMETEKVNVDVTADESGVLTRILHEQGETVHPGDVLGFIEVGAAEPAAPRAPAGPEAVVPTPAPAPTAEAEKKRISPMAQRVAEEREVSLRGVQGRGPSGRIMREDVESAALGETATAPTISVPTAPAVSPQPAERRPAVEMVRPEIRERLSRRRMTIARRLVEAQQTAAMLTTFNEIDMTAVMELRHRRREAFRAATGVDLGFMSFFVKAVVGALKTYPRLNAELQDDELVLKQYYDIGIAIGDPGGLVVPVLRDADRMTFAQIEESIADFVQKARDRTLSLEELRGGTFTITNGGVFGSLLSTPILNPPQVGILGMHKISERPMAAGGQVVVRPMMFVALTYDHRVVDGRDAVLYLVRVKELIEDPGRLLLEG